MKFAAFLAPFFFLFSCAAQPVGEAQKGQPPPASVVSAFSHMGNELTVDVISRSIIRSKEQSLDVGAWGVDAHFAEQLAEQARSRGQEFRAFEFDRSAMEKALAVREGRWKKVVGSHSQSVLELLFRQSDAQGIQYFFLLSPYEIRSSFPLHKGDMGIYCFNRKNLRSRAYAYFFLDFTLWDVKARKKVFQRSVDPSLTQELAFADCREVAELREPLEGLREPVKHTIHLLTQKLMEQVSEKLNWAKMPE